MSLGMVAEEIKGGMQSPYIGKHLSSRGNGQTRSVHVDFLLFLLLRH